MTIQDLEDRLKGYVSLEANRRFSTETPVCGRLKIHAWGRFSEGMDMPYPERLWTAQCATARHLMLQSQASAAYITPETISLVWPNGRNPGATFVGGRTMRMTGLLSAMATAAFARSIRGWRPFEDRLPSFEASLFQAPSREAAANAFLVHHLGWRHRALKILSRKLFSHAEMLGQGREALHSMLLAKGIDFDTLPGWFRCGAFARHLPPIDEQGAIKQHGGDSSGLIKLEVFDDFDSRTDRLSLIFPHR